jgi:hypothetical protein
MSPLSSGQVVCHRLWRAGDRKLNHALYLMAIVQIRHPTLGGPPTGASRLRARHPKKRCAVSLDEYRRCDPSPGSWLLGRRQRTAPLLCRLTASFSPAAFDV